MDHPKITIIVPVYNAENYIKKCIVSIISQTYNDWECLLIDDGSTDKSFDICKEYEKKDKRIRVIHKENGGVSSTRNRGIIESKGDWVFFLDADDYLMTNYLYHLTRNFENVDLVISGFERIGSKNDKVSFSHFGIFDNEGFGKLLNDKYSCFPFWYCWGRLYKKSILINNKLIFKEGLYYHEDTDFLFNYLLKVEKILVSEEVGLVHVCEAQRSNKFKMSYKSLRLHIEALTNSFADVESKFRCNLQTVKYSLYARMSINFLIQLFDTEDKLEFVKEIRNFESDNFLRSILINDPKILKKSLFTLFFHSSKFLPVLINNLLYYNRKQIKEIISNRSY